MRAVAARTRDAVWRQPGRWPRLVALAACALILGMYCTNSDMGGDPRSPRGDGVYRPVLARGDGHMNYLIARSMALDGDWVFDNDLARFGDPWREPMTATGRKAIIHPIGAPLVWTPLIWIAEGGAAIVNVFGAGIQLHGYTLWHQRFVFLSSALAACAAVLLGRLLARRLLGATWAPSYAAAAVLLGTPITYYATYMPSYAHALDAGAAAAFLTYWAVTLGRTDRKRWLVLGALLGLATLIRIQEIALGAVVALEAGVAIVQALRARQRFPLRWLLGGALTLGLALVLFTPQVFEWHVVFGKITELPQGAKYTRLEAPMIMELLFSSRNGWFSTTPIAYLACIGLFCLPRSARLVAAGLLITVVIQVYLNSCVLDWWGSAAHGQRRLCSMTMPLVVGLAALIWRFGRLAARARRVPRGVWHGVLVVLFLIPVWINLAQIHKLRGGKGAPQELTPDCCGGELPSWLRPAARWVYDRIGVPTQFPANAIFALRHDVEWSRWDVAVGDYPINAGMADLHGDGLWALRGVWRIGYPGFETYLVDGLSPPTVVKGGRGYRTTTARSATVLVPNNMPYGQRLTLILAGANHHARVLWNGSVVAEADLTDEWTNLVFDLPDIELHTNELTIEGDPGIRVSELQLGFLPR